MNYTNIIVSLAILLILSFSYNTYGQEIEDFDHDEHMIFEHDYPTPIQAKTSGTTFIQNISELRRDDLCGRIMCLVIDKTNSNHLIAGANTGGLWESNNRGKTWSPIDDHLPSLSIYSIAQDPVQTNIYYASSFENMLATGNNPRPDILKSTDGGKTFQLLPATAGSFTRVRKLATSPNTSGVLYALSGYGTSTRGLYRSTDYGQSFIQVFTYSGFSERDVEVMPNGSVIITVGADVYRSPNGNSGTFNLVNGLNGTNTFTNMDISYCSAQPAVMYGLATGGSVNVGVFKSTDAGKNWTYMKKLNVGRFTNAIGVKPDDPNFVIGGSVGIELTRDGGNSFISYTAGGVDYWSVNYDPANPDRVFTTLDHGINEYVLSPFNSDPQQSYTERDSTLNTAQIYFGDYWNIGDRVVMGMQDNGTLVAGNEEASVGSADGTYCYFHKQDSTVIYFATQNGKIMKKENAFIPFPNTGFKRPAYILNQLDADNNNTVDEGVSFVHPFWMNNADGEQLYYPTRKRLWRSTDGGDNWLPISGTYSTTQQMDAIGNNKPDPIVYWTVEKGLWVMPNAKTAKAGDEFQIPMPGNAETITLHPGNDSIVYMVKSNAGGGPRVYKSDNIFKANVQWQDITGDLPSLLVRCIDVNPDNENELVLGTERGLYVSADGGQHWEQELQFPSVIVSRIRVRETDKRIFIFSYGRGAWAASFPGATSITDAEHQERTLTVWPNPGEKVIHVGAENITKNTSVRLYSLDGKLLQKMSDLQHTPISMNVEDLPSGNYIISTYEGTIRIASAQFVKK